MNEAKASPTEVQAEIQAAVTTLGLSPTQFRQLPDSKAEQVYRACLREFVTASFEPRWWWEHLRAPHAQTSPPDGVLGFDLFLQFVPNPDESCYFIAEDDDAPFYPVYVTTPRVASSVLAECFAYEYYLAPIDLSWLIGESHHDRIFGVGEPVISLLHAHAATTGNA